MSSKIVAGLFGFIVIHRDSSQVFTRLDWLHYVASQGQ